MSLIEILIKRKKTFNTSLKDEEFQFILNQYKTYLSLPKNTDKTLEYLANKFEQKFHLRLELFDFFSLLTEKISKKIFLDRMKEWLPRELIDDKDIHLEGNTRDSFSITLVFSDMRVLYKLRKSPYFDEFSTRGPYDVSYNNYYRDIEIITQESVYLIKGYDSRISSRFPVIPSSLFLLTFKPAEWLLTIHNFLILFEKEKPSILNTLRIIEEESALNRAKEKFFI